MFYFQMEKTDLRMFITSTPDQCRECGDDTWPLSLSGNIYTVKKANFFKAELNYILDNLDFPEL